MKRRRSAADICLSLAGMTDAFAKADKAMKTVIQPAPIPVKARYFYTRCEHCGWHGSSEQCHEARNHDDADVVCPACERIFLADEYSGKLCPECDDPLDHRGRCLYCNHGH